MVDEIILFEMARWEIKSVAVLNKSTVLKWAEIIWTQVNTTCHIFNERYNKIMTGKGQSISTRKIKERDK